MQFQSQDKVYTRKCFVVLTVVQRLSLTVYLQLIRHVGYAFQLLINNKLKTLHLKVCWGEWQTMSMIHFHKITSSVVKPSFRTVLMYSRVNTAYMLSLVSYCLYQNMIVMMSQTMTLIPYHPLGQGANRWYTHPPSAWCCISPSWGSPSFGLRKTIRSCNLLVWPCQNSIRKGLTMYPPL